jgi:hypothetical protein
MSRSPGASTNWVEGGTTGRGGGGAGWEETVGRKRMNTNNVGVAAWRI